MAYQVNDIRNLLTEQGWHISPVDIVVLDWWADEMWALESTWAPRDKRAWLTFLVDPLHSNSAARKKGEAVWAMMLTAQRPWNWQDDHTGLTLPMGRLREKTLKRLDAWLRAYRNSN